MNKRLWGRTALAAATAGFIAINCVLIAKDGSKATRQNYISEWAPLKNGHLKETLSTRGVAVPSEQERVIADRRLEFGSFLVQEGDKVEAGTPLFEYAETDTEEQLGLLDTKIKRLEGEESSITSHIGRLESLLSSLPSPAAAGTGAKQEEQSAKETETFLKEAISAQVLERDKVRHAIEAYRAQRSDLESDKSALTISAEAPGIVEHISYDLKNPVVTIASDIPAIEGRLTESQVKKVKEGMKAEITSKHFKGKAGGAVKAVAELPADKPDMSGESSYRFTALIGEGDKPVRMGYHVTATIILKEAKNAVLAPLSSAAAGRKSPYIWVLNKKGIAEKRKVDTGLQANEKIEIKSGAEAGEFVALNRNEPSAPGPYITPLHPRLLDQAGLKHTSKKTLMTYTLIGLLQH